MQLDLLLGLFVFSMTPLLYYPIYAYHQGTDKLIGDSKIPILVLACNRVSVNRCLDKLLLYRPDIDKFPIIVSQVSVFFLIILLSLLTPH